MGLFHCIQKTLTLWDHSIEAAGDYDNQSNIFWWCHPGTNRLFGSASSSMYAASFLDDEKSLQATSDLERLPPEFAT